MAETKRVFLVIDAGGTSTRAVIVDSSGRCLGYGRAGGGNPTSAGITSAVAAVGLGVRAGTCRQRHHRQAATFGCHRAGW